MSMPPHGSTPGPENHDPYGSPGQPPVPPQDGMPAAPQYSMPSAPAPQYQGGSYAPVGTNPGKGLGIAGFICALIPCVSLVGLVLSIVALSKSRKAGYSNGLALAGIIISALALIGTVIWAVFLGGVFSDIASTCNDLGSGTHYVDGRTYTCP